MSFKLVFILLVIVIFSTTKIRWFLLKLFIKNEPLFVKSKLGLIFCDFFNFPYFKQGLFLFIFILAGNKGNWNLSFSSFKRVLLLNITRRKEKSFSIKGRTPSLSKERKSPLNKNQEDSFFPSSFNKPSACRAFRSQYGLYYNRSVRKPYCNHTCALYRRGRGGDSAILF